MTFKIESAKAESLELYLYFDSSKNQLVLDRDVEQKVKIVKDFFDFFDNNEEVGLADYYYKVITLNNKETTKIYFNPDVGKFILKAPYFENGSRVDIYYKDSEILSLDISGFATCNSNGACEEKLNENAQNCISDCFNTVSKKTSTESNGNQNKTNNNKESSSPLSGSSNTSAENTTQKGNFPYVGLFSGLLLILLGVGFAAYKFWKSRREE